MRLLFAFAFALSVVAACTSSSSPAGPSDASTGDASVGASSSSGSSSGSSNGGGSSECAFFDACAPTTAGPESFCGSVPASWHDFGSVSEMLPYLQRTFLGCNGGVFDIADQAGIAFAADGTYKVLARDASGALVTSTDGTATGTYSAMANGGVVQAGALGGQQGSEFQLTLNAANGQFTIWQTFFADSPPMMLMAPLGTRLYGFVAQDTTGWAPVSAPQPTQGTSHAPPAACASGTSDGGDASEAGDDASSGADASAGPITSGAAIADDWNLCSGPTPSDVRPDFAGVRIDAGGNYEVLVWDASGALAPATDIFESGPWQIEQSFQGPLALQTLDFAQPLGGWGGQIDVAALPDRLDLSTWTFVRRSVAGL